MNPPVSCELIHPNRGDVIVVSCDYNTDSGPTLKEILDVINVVVPAFPNNRVIFIPNDMSLRTVNKNALIDIRNSVNQILKSIKEREANE